MNTRRSFLAPDLVFEKLKPFCTVRSVERSAVLFLQGEAPREVLLLTRGEIALTPDAKDASLCRVAGPGSILGLPANLSGRPYLLTAVSIVACEFAAVSRRRFVEALRKDPEITLGIVRMLAEEIAEMRNLAVQLRLTQLNSSTSQ